MASAGAARPPTNFFTAKLHFPPIFFALGAKNSYFVTVTLESERWDVDARNLKVQILTFLQPAGVRKISRKSFIKGLDISGLYYKITTSYRVKQMSEGFIH